MTARRLYAAIAAAVSQMFLLCHLSYAESLADATDSSALEISAAVMESGRCDGIKVRFLGTGAADWKNRSKGTERRRLTSILVDDAILVDYTASDRDMLPCAVIPEAILYTHSHSDHFDAAAAKAAGLDAHSTGSPIHGLIMEATMSDDEDFRIFTHSSVGTVLRTVNVLEKTGRYTPAPGQRVYLTHLARTLHGTQQELDASLPEPLKVAFDGLEMVFSRPL